jgi:DNA-binding CsgD family transcriptional regulator
MMDHDIETQAASKDHFWSRPTPATALDQTASAADLLAFLRRLDCAALILNRSGEVTGMNDAAEELLKDDLFIRDKHLHAKSRKEQKELERFLDGAFNQMSERAGAIALLRENGERPFVLQAIPLAPRWLAKGPSKKPATVLLVINHLERGDHEPQSAALEALGLTPAEISVATFISAGFSAHEVSKQLGVSVLTVRSHLKNIFRKLDLQRQADLVRIVTRLTFVK